MTETREATPERFGPYELVDLLGRGGMGEVHRAYDTTRKRTVALKLLPRHLAGDGEYQARFRREAEVAARLTEPHIIPIHDYGEIDGTLYIDMRLIKGVDLSDVIAQAGPLPAARAVDIIGQTGTALAAAHGEGLVHRDVKPSNVLISTTDRGEDFVHLVDFGIAHEQSSPGLTATGATIGTIDYMAPERLMQERTDHRVDVYALGCVLYEALTATKPFPVGTAAAKMYAHMHTPPPRPTQLRRDIPPAFDDVVAIAMAKNPAERYASTTDLTTAAYRALAETRPLPGRPPEPPMGPGGGSVTGAATRVAPGTYGGTGYGMTPMTPRPATRQQPAPQHPTPQRPAPQHPTPQQGPGLAATRVTPPPTGARTGTTAALTPHLPPQHRPPGGTPPPDSRPPPGHPQGGRTPGGEPPVQRSRRPLVIALAVAAVAVVAVVGFVLTRSGTPGTAASATGTSTTATAAGSGQTSSGGQAGSGSGSGSGGSATAPTVVTDANGRQTQLQTSTVQLCGGDSVSLSGQEVPVSTISRIDVTYVGSLDVSVKLTLTSGQQAEGKTDYGCSVTGKSDIGTFTLPLSKIRSVEIPH